MPQHLEVAGHIVEHLGDVFAELAHPAAAFRATAAGRCMNDGLARQMGGEVARFAAQGKHCAQRTEITHIGSGRIGFWRDLCHIVGHRQITECQLELAHQFGHALRRTSVLPALEPRYLRQQLRNRLVTRGQQAFECSNIVGERGGLCHGISLRHDRSLV